MALNPYNPRKVRSEQNLYEDLVIESIKMFGIDVKYLPRKMLAVDDLLNEDSISRFDSAYTIEMYVETVDGFEGDGRLFSKFGLEIREQATLIVAKRRWYAEVGVRGEGTNPLRPSEGDLIYVPMTKSMFEVRFVEHESPFYQLQNVPCFKLQVELFEYRNEAIRTGDAAVDSSEKENAFTVAAEIEMIEGLFNVADDIVQLGIDGGITGGHVMRIEKRNDNYLAYIGDISSSDKTVREFTEGSVVTAKNGTVSGTVIKIYTLSDLQNLTAENDHLEQNHLLEQKSHTLIDFSEDNPFGDLRPPTK